MSGSAIDPGRAAFHGIEGAIYDMRDLALLMDLAAEATVYLRDASIEAFVREKTGLAGMHVCVMTEDQSQALDFILHRVVEHARKLQRDYEAALVRMRACA